VADEAAPSDEPVSDTPAQAPASTEADAEAGEE
jgi:hypothetical protein